MADLTADLFVSLDGFAGAVNAGPYFDYGGPDLDVWVQHELAQPQVVLMGRVTYQAMAAISAPAGDEVNTGMTALPKAVVSNTLTEPLAWQNTRLLRGDPATGVRALKEESEVPLRSIGSLTLVRTLVALGLVDRLRLMVFPLTLGADGREPAYAGYPRAGFELTASTVLDSRLLLLEYRPAP